MKTITNLLSMAASRRRSKEQTHAPSVAVKGAALTNAASEVHWITLDQLPGWMWTAVRAMGESIFKPLTTTPLPAIEVIANLGGLGPHSEQAIDVTTQRLRETIGSSNILEYATDQIACLFGASYRAQAVQFDGTEHTYLLVRDQMGRYIYRWPSSDTKTPLVGPGSMAALPLDRAVGEAS